MSYPDTIPAVTDQLSMVAYASGTALTVETKQALIEAAAHASIVERCHQTVAALAPVFQADGETMPLDARQLLAGSLQLCASHNWVDRGAVNYAAVLAGVIATLPAEEPAEDPEDA